MVEPNNPPVVDGVVVAAAVGPNKDELAAAGADVAVVEDPNRPLDG